jgi:hypothetical protein
VRLTTDTTFHRKLYVASTPRVTNVVIGSSNLSDGGLLGSGELNVLLTLAAGSQDARRLQKIRLASWKAGVALTRRRITVYEQHAHKNPARQLPATVIREILGNNAGRAKADEIGPDRPRRFWIDYITHYASAQTEAIIAAETDWDRHGWAWYGTRTAAINEDDHILLFDRSDRPGWVSMVRVVATTPTPASTPDGRHFVAYVQERGTCRRRPGRRLTGAVKQAGVKAVNGSRLRLSQEVWHRLRELFSR